MIYMRAMNITLSIDEKVVAKARSIASRRGTSLNQMVRDYLNQLTQQENPWQTLERLEALWNEATYRSPDSWTRDELHERT